MKYSSKKNWFECSNWSSWHPSSWQGWLITLVYVFLVIFTFLRIDINSHSVSDTLIRLFAPFIIYTVIFVYLCKKTSLHGK